MKKLLSWTLALILILSLLPAAQAEANRFIPDFASFSDSRFVLAKETDYGVCTLTTYEASFADSDKAALEEIMTAYKDWFMGNSEMTPGGEHSASFGRFGAYAQETVWFTFNESAGLSAFSMNLADTQAKYCHVMLAFKEYEDKVGLDLYVSKGIELTEATVDPVVIPDFAAYVGSLLLGSEEINGQTVYKLPKDSASDILLAYATVLEEKYGFSTFGNGNVEGMNYVWFENHETIPSKPLDNFGLDGKGCFVFAFANVEGEYCAILYPNDGFVMEDTGERYQTNVMIPMAVDESGSDSEVRAPLPDFAAYAGDAILEYNDGIYTMNRETGTAVLTAYSELLENKYGLSTAKDGLANDFLLMWYTDYVNPEAAGDMILINLDDGTQAKGYFYFVIGAAGDDLLLSLQYAEGMTMVDNGERYFVGQPVPAPVGEETQGKLTVPMLEAFMSDAVKEMRQVDGVTTYRINQEHATAVLQYFDVLENYGLYQVDETEEEYGIPMYLFVERCEQDLEPMDVELYDSKVHCYVLISVEPVDNDFLITVRYADCLDPVDTGERWDGRTLSDMMAEEEDDDDDASESAEQPASSERVLVSEPKDASEFAHVYSPDTAFVQDMVNYCAGRLSYSDLSDSKNYMVRNYSGSRSDYQVVKDYVDMLVEINPYLELQDFCEKTYDYETFYSFAIDYTGSVNLGPQAKQTYTDNMCDIMLYGNIERDRLELSIWTPANVELVDLGMRYDGTQADVSIGGESALAGLYRNADGTFETSDGRFRVAPGEAMILRDGKEYTTEATFDRDKKGNRDRIWMRYFYRNETLHFSYPTHSLMTGDLFRLRDFDREDSWLLRDRGIFDNEQDLSSKRWNGLFLGANHDGDWMTPVNDPTSSFTDGTVRVMYMDKEIAVFYIFAEYTTAPYTMEALAAVPLTDKLTEDEIDYTTYVGQSINVSYEWTKFGASYELFNWEIISGGELAALSNEKSQTCTLTAYKPGLVGIRVTYDYGTKEPDILTGIPTNAFHTNTQDYTIMIK